MNWHEAERRSVHGKHFAHQVGRKHPYRVIAERTLPGFDPEPYMGPLEGDPGIQTSEKEFSNFRNRSRHYNIIMSGERRRSRFAFGFARSTTIKK